MIPEARDPDGPEVRALHALRDAHPLGRPDRALEARLLAQHRWRRGRRPRALPLGLALAALSGAAFAAGGGIEWLRSFWYRIEVDGVRVSGAIEDGGARVHRFEVEGGGATTVAVEGAALPGGGTRTRIAVEQVAPDRVERDEIEDVFGGPQPARERVGIEAVAGRAPLYVGPDPEGGDLALYLLMATDGARLCLHRPRREPGALEVVGRLPVTPAGARPAFACERLDDGALAVRVRDGEAFAFELLVRLAGAAPAGAAPATELETPDGRVRVRVEPESEPRDRR